jgi:putative phosphoribosyl transferase
VTQIAIPYPDREHAGRLLADRLEGLIAPPCVIGAIPRGGLVVALPLAERLHAPLGIVFVRKLTVPSAPELAIGAVDEDGEILVDRSTAQAVGASVEDIAAARRRARHEIERQKSAYPSPPLAALLPGAAAVLVDDGLATGLTMRAALGWARRHGAREVIVAAPCAAASSARRFDREADRFISPVIAGGSFAVGAFYHDFHAVSDQEVLDILERAKSLLAPPTDRPPGPA